jgi:glutathione S-transferase
MVLDFYYGSGSPYSWRVWLALEHKTVGYDLKMMSFDAGDLQKPEFLALNPRHKVPVLYDRGFVVYESAAILEYLEGAYASSGQRLFPVDAKQRATARRLVCEVDHYVAPAMETLANEILFTPVEKFDANAIAEGRKAFAEEMAMFERYAQDKGFLAGANAGAVDFALYPMIALVLRMERKKKDLDVRGIIPSKLAAWMQRVEQLPYFEKTIPPHWKKG